MKRNLVQADIRWRLIRRFYATDIKRGQRNLEPDNRERLNIPTPGNPQDIADEGTYKSGVASALGWKSQQPDRKYIDYHRGPL